MRFLKRSIRQDDRSHRDFTRARGPSRKRRLQLENLEERALLSTYSISESYLAGVPVVSETINNVTTNYVNPASPFVVTTASGSNTVNILNTSAHIAINVNGQGLDTVNVGNAGSAQGILGALSIQNPPSYTTINVNDGSDATARTVTLSTFTSGGYNWGSITGLAPAAINYKYGDTTSVSVTTGTAADTINVLATGVPTSVSTGGGSDVVNVGNAGSARGILGTLSIQNPPSYTTINVNNGSDATTRTVALSTYSSGGYNWGSITGLAPAAINYKYYDTRSPVNISTLVGRVSWNVSANAMSSFSGVVVYDNGFAINSVPTEPTADTAYSPAPASAPLFNSGGPSYLDVEQGAVGDCWLMASLAEVAARDPQDIRNMFTYDGTIVDNGATVGLYTVRFFNTNGAAVSVEVDTELPSGGAYYDRVTNGVLWVALAEKAYAEANGAGIVTTQYVGSDSYAALDGGDPSWALQAITGKPASDYSINPANIAAAWNAGQLIVLGSSPNAGDNLIVGDSNGTHAYAVISYNASSSTPFELYNPWGLSSVVGHTSSFNGHQVYDGPFWFGSSLISQDFAWQHIGTGTAAGPDVHGNSSQAGAASANSGSAISVSTRSSAQEPLLIALAPTSFSQSIGHRHDHLDRALGSLMEDDLAFLRS
ncbi:MAG: C2 family cysteine protease [Isosphaeraceae bacterium]